VGFEPTVAKGDTRSPGAPDKPLQHLSAERVGFEPTAPFGAPLFESGTISLSVTSPWSRNYTMWSIGDYVVVSRITDSELSPWAVCLSSFRGSKRPKNQLFTLVRASGWGRVSEESVTHSARRGRERMNAR
jgi:hypothetical protein